MNKKCNTSLTGILNNVICSTDINYLIIQLEDLLLDQGVMISLLGIYA